MGELLNNLRVAARKVVVRRVSLVAAIALCTIVNTIPLPATVQIAKQDQNVVEDAELALEVVDIQASACAGAKVELSKADSSQSILVITNDLGLAPLTHLSPGTYQLVVKFPGFETFNKTVTIGEGRLVQMKVTLYPGATYDPIEVRNPAVPVLEPAPVVIEPVRLSPPSTKTRGFFRRAFQKLFHSSR